MPLQSSDYLWRKPVSNTKEMSIEIGSEQVMLHRKSWLKLYLPEQW